jgi:hypothetical protein
MRALTALSLVLALGACGEPTVDGRDHAARCLGVPAAEVQSVLDGLDADSLLSYDCEQLRVALVDGKTDLGPALAELARRIRALVDAKYRHHVCAQAQDYVQECMAGGGAWDLVACDADQERAARYVLEQKVCPWHTGKIADPVELRVAMVAIGFWMLDLPPAIESAQKKKDAQSTQGQ